MIPRPAPTRPAALTPPAVRLAAALTCPACDAAVRRCAPVTGRAWLTCERNACRAEWLNVVLAPGATVATLATATALPAPLAGGLALALAVVLVAPLVPVGATAPGHLQLVVTGHQRHRAQYAPLATLLRLALASAAASDVPLAKAG